MFCPGNETKKSCCCPENVKKSPETLEMMIETMRAAGEYLLDEAASLDVAYAELFGERTVNPSVKICQRKDIRAEPPCQWKRRESGGGLPC